jgi:hypothetical protein
MNDGFEGLQKLGYSHKRIGVSLKPRWIGCEDVQPDDFFNLELLLSPHRSLAGQGNSSVPPDAEQPYFA